MAANISMNMSILEDGRQSSRYANCLKMLAKVMDIVQSDLYNEKKKKEFVSIRKTVMDQVRTIFQEVGLKVFSETIIRMMLVVFRQKSSSNPYHAKLISFFFDCVTDAGWIDEDVFNSQDSNQSVMNGTNLNSTIGSVVDDGQDSDPFPLRIVRLCEKYSVDTRALVRLRLLQTIDKIIPHVIEVNHIRRTLKMRLIRMLLTRRKDKNEQVRTIAVKILCNFYRDPKDESVPFQKQIREELLTHMAYDPEPSVRQTIVSHITTTVDTWDHIVERAGDPIESVRVAAIERTAVDIPLSQLTVEYREAILKANTGEPNMTKKTQTALNHLLKTWLKACGENICEFLRIINVRRRTQLCRVALNALYCSEPSEEAFDKISSQLLCDKKYPDDSLSVESTFLWLYVYEKFKNDEYIMKKLKLSVEEMIEYIMEYVDVVEEEGDNLSPTDLDYRAWMLGDLLRILSHLPEEEGERKAILNFVSALCLKKKLMDLRNSRLVFNLIYNCADINNEAPVVDLVNSVLESDTPSRRGRSRSTTQIQNRPVDNTIVHQPQDIEQLKRELGNLVHRSKKLDRDQRIAVSNDDMVKATDIQKQLDTLQNEINIVKKSIEDEENRKEESFVSAVDSTIDEEMEEAWVYSDKTMLITMAIVNESIQRKQSVSTFCRMFYEMYVTKAVAKCFDARIRGLALELMCLIAMDCESELPTVAMYCVTALLKDHLIVKKSALKCLYDLVLKYSFFKLGELATVQSVFMGLGSNKEFAKIRRESSDNPAHILKGLLLSFLRHNEPCLVKITVSGILKLLVCKREMNFMQIITKFLMSWAIPSCEVQARFKDVAIMIPIYATLGENEAIEISNCLMQCVKKSLEEANAVKNDDAPPGSDIDKIVNLIVQCSHPDKLINFQRPYIAHQTIALSVLEELKDDSLTTDERKLYIKMLKLLDLSKSPKESIKEMSDIAAEILVSTNKMVSQNLSKFTIYLESLISNGEEGNDTVRGAFDDEDMDADDA